MSERRFRFAVTVDGRDRAALAEMVRKAEDFGFDVIAGVDHIGPPVGVFPMLASVAQLTSLRVSPMVVANDYRHPVMLAKDCATIDVLSDGRFELGIGTGWIREQYESAGLRYDGGGTRVDRLTESLAVLRGCWTGEPFRFSGKHYQVNLVGSPVPVQRPHPPVLIAGAGPRMLRLAGRQADIVGITLTYGHSGFDTFDPAIATSGTQIADQLSIFNYLYSLLEAETIIGCGTVGLDAGMGLLHADQPHRANLALDIMEAARPAVDAYVLDLLESHRFRANDFHETRRGVCRALPSLTHLLAVTTQTWQTAVAPVIEDVADTLADPNSVAVRAPTPLTQRNRRAGRAAIRKSEPTGPATKPPMPPNNCGECGQQIPAS